MSEESSEHSHFQRPHQNDAHYQNDYERSRQKRSHYVSPAQDQPSRKNDQKEKNFQGISASRFQNRFKNANSQQEELFDHNDDTDFKSQLLRSFLRIQQDREQPIDKFVKIAWTYKGKFIYDHHLNQTMKNPSKFLDKLTSEQLLKTAQSAKGHSEMEKMENSKLEHFWSSLIELIDSKLAKRNSVKAEQNRKEYGEKIAEIISKPLPELIKLEKQIKMILKNQSYGSNNDYWRHVLQEIKTKKCEGKLFEFYETFKAENSDQINDEENKIGEEILQEPTSPTLVPYSSVNPKLLVKEQEQKEKRSKLGQKIFTEQFQKGRQKLEINLSLPHNHGLLSTQIITEQNVTYDQITKEIIQFEKYKRMEDDEEEFNDWVPCQTEGRFRDRKPVYLNRVRITREVLRYGSVHHYTEDNPPPKSIQGYKFNIFYPDLYDKQKTPQYYLSNTDDPNYCIITFKAGPPYKDIAFKILKKEWEFTEKSGFESIFSRGILHLYFNFKLPRFRI